MLVSYYKKLDNNNLLNNWCWCTWWRWWHC